MTLTSEEKALFPKVETSRWYALRIGPDRFAIFDVFPDADAKAARFGGEVAAALKANAESLIPGGWEKGVAANIRTCQVLSASNGGRNGFAARSGLCRRPRP
jgi:hypothetical protein